MSILQFLRIIWAYRILIAITTVVCTILGVATVQLVKPRYEAQSRVMLDVIKPDPVTGQVMATAFLRAYTKTQIELVKDLQVAHRVVEDLKWDKDPVLQKAYRNRKKSQQDLDFGRWASEVVMQGANAKLIEGSNILEISYGSSSPEQAKLVADGLRKAYVEMTLQSRREAARRNAEWYEEQAVKSKAILFQAEAEKAAFERSSGILLQDDKVDVDSARLAALANQGGASMITPSSSGVAPSAAELGQVESALGEASKILGPNHPQLQALRKRREMLIKQVDQERNSASASAGAALSAARATTGMLEAQKAKVMGQRDKVERLRLMQDGIDLRREQYNKGVARAAQLRQEAEVAEAGIIPLASAITPQSPAFPKKGLMITAAVLGGAGLGVLAGLMIELFGRRVRSSEDLASVIDAPVLAVIHGQAKPRRSRRLPGVRGRRRQPAQAARA